MIEIALPLNLISARMQPSLWVTTAGTQTVARTWRNRGQSGHSRREWGSSGCRAMGVSGHLAGRQHRNCSSTAGRNSYSDLSCPAAIPRLGNIKEQR